VNKFRVYDKREQQYVEEYAEAKGQFEVFIRPDGKLRCYEETADCVGVRELDPLRFIVEWFTGFCDSQGREIYINDVCMIQRPYSNRTDIHAVAAFHNGMLWFERHDIDNGETWVFVDEIACSDVNVTGTIHDGEAS